MNTHNSPEAEIVKTLKNLLFKTYEIGVQSGLNGIKGGPVEWCQQGQRAWIIHTIEPYVQIMRAGPNSLAFRTLVQVRARMNDILEKEALARSVEEWNILVNPTSGPRLK